MIAVDTNVLLYAHREELELHEKARTRLVALAQSPAAWAIPVFVLGEFLRVITHRKVFNPPHSVEEACEALARVLASPSLRVLQPGAEFMPLLFQVLQQSSASGNIVFDAQIVALCREHGVTRILTQDRDFHRFEDLQIERLR